jgi:protein-S-isoprenylcysteine O-methyltransferase Ste14
MIETGIRVAERSPSTAAARALTLLYGVGTYVFFFATFLYLIGFVGNWVVPKSIDSGIPAGSIGSAIAIDVLLLAAFAVQHTIMARPSFKTWWTRYVPWCVERSTFVLLATAILAVMAWQWRPLPTVVWRVENGPLAALLSGISLAGWGIVLIATCLIDHFELFGLRQTALYALGRTAERPAFKERLFYRWVRHPLMLGFLIAFWFTPVMTQGHLLFAVVTTAYILVALQIEERTLLYLHGDRYRDYQERVSMLLPFGRPRGARERHGPM